ncbi:hypothetical protein SAMN04490183_1139 [Pseudomonas corrugata]|nr:hypothetical protein SAMN04490183_1139 [Pseudomonas corrugata]
MSLWRGDLAKRRTAPLGREAAPLLQSVGQIS